MIASVTGTVAAIGPTSVVVEVGGLGVLALCTPNTAAGLRLGTPATLATSLVVREDSLTLYGFGSADERELFELLLGATGVGPKLAQAALAVLTPDELRRAIGSEDLARLTRVPGIGRKGAQRLVIELKDKIGAPNPAGSSAALVSPTIAGTSWHDQVTSGLEGLGWSAKDAEAAWAEVEHQTADPQVSVATLMRAALQALARR